MQAQNFRDVKNPPPILYQIKYRGRNEMYPGNGTEGAIGCTDVGRQQRPQFHFLRVSFIPSPGMKCVQTLSCARVHPTLSIFYEIGCPMDVIERTFYNRYGLQTLLNWVQFVSCSSISNFRKLHIRLWSIKWHNKNKLHGTIDRMSSWCGTRTFQAAFRITPFWLLCVIRVFNLKFPNTHTLHLLAIMRDICIMDNINDEFPNYE